MSADVSPDLAAAVVADHCHLRIPSRPEWIAPTIDYLMQRASQSGAVHPGRATKIMLALNEALTNSIIHGNLGISSRLKDEDDSLFAQMVASRCADPAYALRMVEIRTSYDGRVARWSLTDQGEGFDFSEALRQLDSGGFDPLRVSGRGMLMIRAFTDEMRYEENGRRLVLALHRSGDEKRSQPRWALNGPVGVVPLDEEGLPSWDERREALGRNISSGGIAFLGTGPAPGERVLLTLPGGAEPIEVHAEVRHWQPLTGNVIEVGCRFETPRPPGSEHLDPVSAELARLVAILSERQRPFGERRSALRVTYTECLEVELPDGEVRRGFGRDLSRMGISFLCVGSLPREVVSLRLPPTEGQHVPLLVRATIVRSTHLVDGFYDVAAQFLRD
jgi:anti-sigma regulatory factor (Ser/Thr protein kinase)